ncbi:hypothetical protein EFK50_07140 [Nocardioides marmoriginsengisoli]|uniref:Heavy-metal-associated domain-containing protein n=1 Tax=Nocardioides marmoriginsengisoli TaxID=661483 RepID=A0A3N0CLF5_9ACTN|nr:hypothetical protein [Nocardioides marmoriginsengisoli]RNL64295.1 hypothetical protein EFK50_07140 [Nocardioides marmoriginsengisoli]
MNTPTRLAAYGAGLAVVLTGGWLLGDRTDLGDVDRPTESHSGAHAGDTAEGNDMKMTDGTAKVPGGLQVAENGYSLDLAPTGYTSGTQTIEFKVLGPDGEPLTDYTEEHEKDLHLIVVRRSFSDFQHVHPTLDRTTGTWSVDVDLEPGTWRVFADFVPAGADEGLTLGTDLFVAGSPGNESLPEVVRTATVGGFTVTVAGDLAAGEHSMLEFEVSRNGRPVTDLEPYLGAYGHLVALRERDLAYLHVHPGGEPGDGKTEPGPTIDFGAEVPSAGRYHLYLDFKVGGVVRTAQFALDATRGTR